jgi:predicted nucleic acid-binding protein
MVINELKGQYIFLDTAPLIYFIEGNTEFQQILSNIFNWVDKGELTFISSTITLLEVLVKPLKENLPDIVEKYTNILTSSKGIDIFDLTISVAKEASKLRSKYNLRTPDAIQLVTAITYDANIFFTNDSKLKIVTEIEVAVLSELRQI